MRKTVKIRSFLINNKAISEEFTTLPALSVVMLGFTLFFLLLAQVYTAYQTRIDQIQNYRIAETIINTLLNPDCPFIKEGGCIDIITLSNDTYALTQIQEYYSKSGIVILLKLHWANVSKYFPEPPSALPNQRIAITKNVAISLNEAQTTPGTVTLLFWRETL